MTRLRVVNWNLHGAFVPGKASKEQQQRAWHLMAEWDADFLLLQEVGTSAIPKWARDRWDLVLREDSGWGSLVGAKPHLSAQALDRSTADPWVDCFYSYVVVAEITLPGGSECWACSVHAIVRELPQFLEEKGHPDLLSQKEIDGLRRTPFYAGIPYVNDFAWGALRRATKGKRFIIAGDWTTARLMDNPSGSPFGWAFFNRAPEGGWHDCHIEKNEERTLLQDGRKPFQLDHIVCDRKTATKLLDCSVG